jgi:diguanylate cyclase (GGDEF)-like protein
MILFILCSYFSDSLPVIYAYSNKKVIAGMYAFNAFIAFTMTILFSLLFTFEIRNAQLVMERRNRRLDVIASLDPLTGLLNRRSMEQHLNTSIRKAKEQNRAFSLVLCDIDDFKKVNDTYGHDCGDQVLIKVSDIIRSHMREFDFVCRWGGEEILILLDCDINVAKLVVERIRYEINVAPLYFDETNVAFTMTFGISTYTDQCTVDSLIQQADEKLYIGKRNGKNKVVA